MFLCGQTTSILCLNQEATLLKLPEALRRVARRILILQQKQKQRELLTPIAINSQVFLWLLLFIDLWGKVSFGSEVNFKQEEILDVTPFG
jgi:hypothetical protein